MRRWSVGTGEDVTRLLHGAAISTRYTVGVEEVMLVVLLLLLLTSIHETMELHWEERLGIDVTTESSHC